MSVAKSTQALIERALVAASTTCVATPEQYRQAQRAAKAKGVHSAPAGVLELRASWSWRVAAPQDGDCGWSAQRNNRRGDNGDDAAQLRSVVVRLTVGAVVDSGGTTRTAGKPSWVPAGVLCRKCGAFWLAPVEAVDD